jgi:hypothetical protein
VTMDRDPTATVGASNRLRGRAVGFVVTAVLVAAGLGACGGSSSPVTSNTPATSATTVNLGTSGSPNTTATTVPSTTAPSTTAPSTTAPSTTAPSTTTPSTTTRSTAGSGEAMKSAAQIVKDARLATARVRSVDMKGSLSQGRDHVALDIVAGQDSGGGSITSEGATFEAILRPPKLYLRASAASWTKSSGSAAAGKLLAGKWISATKSTSGFQSFVGLLRIGKFISKLSSPRSLAKGAVTTFDGVRAIPITATKKDSTWYVAATGKPYILAIIGRGSKYGTLTFTDYNSATIPAAPATSVSFKQLEHEG